MQPSSTWSPTASLRRLDRQIKSNARTLAGRLPRADRMALREVQTAALAYRPELVALAATGCGCARCAPEGP